MSAVVLTIVVGFAFITGALFALGCVWYYRKYIESKTVQAIKTRCEILISKQPYTNKELFPELDLAPREWCTLSQALQELLDENKISYSMQQDGSRRYYTTKVRAPQKDSVFTQ